MTKHWLPVSTAFLILFPTSALATQGALEIQNDSTTVGYVRVANSPQLEPQTFTLEAWIRPDGDGFGLSTNGASFLVMPSEGAAGVFVSSWHLAWRPVDGRIYTAVAHAMPNSGTTITGATAILPGEVAHVALTFDGSELLLYVDGALDGASAATAATIDYRGDDVLMGASNFCCGYLRRFDGAVDEVRIWDHAKNGVERIGVPSGVAKRRTGRRGPVGSPRDEAPLTCIAMCSSTSGK